MLPPILRLASRHPEIWVGSNKCIKLFDIAGLRFELSSLIIPTDIRVKINNSIIIEEPIKSKKNCKIHENDFINLWFQTPILDKPEAKLEVELKFFGLYFRVKTLNIYCLTQRYSDFQLKSDAFVDPRSLSATNQENTDLIKAIYALPSVVRSMKSNSLRKTVKKIVVFRLDQLGDFILTVPAIIRLKSIFPDAEITAIVSPANVDCARSLNLFTNLIEVPFSFETGTNKRYLSNEAKTTVLSFADSQNFDVAIDLSVMPESRPLLALINANYKVGFENTDSYMMDLGVLLHAKDPVNMLSNVSHATYPMLIVEATRLALCPEYSHIPTDIECSSVLREFELTPRKYVVIHSGSRNILARWPQDKFVALATEIAARGEAVIFFSDDPVPDHLQIVLQQAQIQVFSGGMTFDQFDAVLSFARVYIGNDTGPKHLAALRGVPVVSIHAARSNWSEWGQVDSGYTISRRVPCAGCGIETKRECGRDLVCLNNITVQEVFDCYSTIE
jgi:ADP-heptose:LPS heptosyltransferase